MYCVILRIKKIIKIMSFTAAEREKRLSFASEHSNWDNVLFAKFGVVKCMTVWVAVNRFEPCRTVIFDGFMSEMKYMDILNKTLLPFLLINEGMTYIQVNSTILSSLYIKF